MRINKSNQIKSKHLKGLKLKFNNDEQLLGKLNLKNKNFEIKNQSTNRKKTSDINHDNRFGYSNEVGDINDEIGSFKLLLPVNDKNKLNIG